jgi:hypothetical protein
LGPAISKTHGQIANQFVQELTAMRAKVSDKSYGPIFDLARLRIAGELRLAKGDAAGAVEDFHRADVVDAVITPRNYLARALSAMGDKQQSAEKRIEMRQRALDAYDRVVSHPSTIWYYAPDSPPGYFADSIAAYLRIASSAGIDRGKMGALVRECQHLRTADGNTFCNARK